LGDQILVGHKGATLGLFDVPAATFTVGRAFTCDVRLAMGPEKLCIIELCPDGRIAASHPEGDEGERVFVSSNGETQGLRAWARPFESFRVGDFTLVVFPEPLAALRVRPEGGGSPTPTAKSPLVVSPTDAEAERRALALRITTGRQARVIELAGTILKIGSAPGLHFTVEHKEVSQLHCALKRGVAGWTLQDEGSSNGTWIGGVRVQGGVAVKDGTVFTLSLGRSAPRCEILPLADALAHEAEPEALAKILGSSKVIREFRRWLTLVAPRDEAVLLTGESGTGKTEAAKALCVLRDPAHVLINVDATTLSNREMAAALLFGVVKGAYTGAIADKAGCSSWRRERRS
jgi:pSer/pThr/pTyr-binding forkhead associated (FHA) protein